jgi:hypothetical protein
MNRPRLSLPTQSTGSAAATPARGFLIQRKCACGASAGASGECESCALERQADRMAAQALAGQRTESADSVRGEQRVPASVHQAIDSSGQPLSPDVRLDMEQRFGHDFSKVRVHADPLGQRSAQDVDADAYTAGQHVAFAPGHYAPQTPTGRRLLAHELAHVVQQSGTRATTAGATVQRQSPGQGQQGGAQQKIVPPVAPNQAQQKMIDAARNAAAIRTQRAMFKARGIEGTQSFLEAKRLAQIKFDWADPNMDQIAEVLSGMGGGLVNVDIKVVGANDPDCGSRSGYVRGHQQPIVLCPAFFRDPANNEGRIRTLIHEMAHVKGIGKADLGEQYFPVFDCDSKGAFESADSWAHYVHCLSGQTPDQPIAITGRRPPANPPANPPAPSPPRNPGGRK